MQNRKDTGATTLYCFTPLASLVTFAIELLFALYVIIRYRMTAFGRLTALLLLLLGTFQLAEYSICGGVSPAGWAKVAFLSITYLPVIALHLISIATKKRLWTRLGYAIGTVFMGIILFSNSVILGTSCPGKYVIFDTETVFTNAYALYYLGFLAAGILALVRHIRTQPQNRLLFVWLLVGYGSFVVPTFILYVWVSETRPAFPSILCGFALIFGAILVGKVLPLYEKRPVTAAERVQRIFKGKK